MQKVAPELLDPKNYNQKMSQVYLLEKKQKENREKMHQEQRDMIVKEKFDQKKLKLAQKIERMNWEQ